MVHKKERQVFKMIILLKKKIDYVQLKERINQNIKSKEVKIKFKN